MNGGTATQSYSPQLMTNIRKEESVTVLFTATSGRATESSSGEEHKDYRLFCIAYSVAMCTLQNNYIIYSGVGRCWEIGGH